MYLENKKVISNIVLEGTQIQWMQFQRLKPEYLKILKERKKLWQFSLI